MTALSGASSFAQGALSSAGDAFNSVTSGAFSGGLSPTYQPKNVFSFAFYIKQEDGSYDLSDPTGVEYFFVNGPTQYSENFKYRTSVDKTFGGTVVVDYGPDNHEIRMEGEFHIYFRGLPGTPRGGIPGDSGNGFFQSALSAGKALVSNAVGSYYDSIRTKYLALAGGDFRSGLQEFQDFMYMLHYSRSLDPVQYTSGDPQGRKVVNFFSGLRLNWKEIAMVFRDYDRNRTVEVIVPQNGFTISRAVQDTNTYKYSLNLTTVRELDAKILSPLVRSNFNPSRTISGLMNELENLVNLPLKLSGTLLGVAKFAQTFANSADRLKTSWGRMKDQFNLEGRLARKTFDSARSTLGIGGKTRGFSAEEISNAIDAAYSQSRAREADFRQALEKAESDLSAFLSAVGFFSIPISGSSSYAAESVKPGADFTAWIDNEAYDFAINARDILNETRAAINYAAIDDGFRIRKVGAGETYNSIAKAELGNAKLGEALARYNNDSDTTQLAKAAIKIPYGKVTNIFTTLPEQFTPRDLEVALIGADLKLTENRGIAVAPNGDWALVEGDETLINNILDPIDFEQGSLPANPSIGNPIPIGSLPDDLVKNSYLAQILGQIRSDPRVSNAQYLGAIQEGDKYLFLFTVTSISGGSFYLSL
ncbi:hypothetical protein EHO57_13860 [Leptospira langatensis]|uniref:Uncharacterized protein n=1 Tax=Leptospira langatensis TaxID=2484983 RepID=A0A5R2AT66_9LEPT|nr:hypothetical protein [Leptospira langatensis]TGJ99841.1 hypothetical protein EHO57_13860 [Leptospira langatensis]